MYNKDVPREEAKRHPKSCTRFGMEVGEGVAEPRESGEDARPKFSQKKFQKVLDKPCKP